MFDKPQLVLKLRQKHGIIEVETVTTRDDITSHLDGKKLAAVHADS
jgi:hypothetical protein